MGSPRPPGPAVPAPAATLDSTNPTAPADGPGGQWLDAETLHYVAAILRLSDEPDLAAKLLLASAAGTGIAEPGDVGGLLLSASTVLLQDDDPAVAALGDDLGRAGAALIAMAELAASGTASGIPIDQNPGGTS